MEAWLEFAKGPLLRFSLAIMILGALRLIILQVWGVIEAWYRSGNKALPIKKAFKETLTWMVPFSKLHRFNPVQGFASFIFHLGMLLIPLFYIEHIGIWHQVIGLSWPGFSRAAADPLTILTLISLTVLLGIRIRSMNVRFLSNAFDYGALILLFVVFFTGYFSSHPTWSPIPHNLVLLIHILSAEAVIMMLPFTKLAHVALYATTRLSSETGWSFVPDAGERVTAALGKEGQV